MKIRNVLISVSVLAAGLSVVALTGLNRSEAGPQAWRDRFVACANGDMVERTLIAAEVQTCILGVMLDSVEAGDVMGMQRALAAQIQLTPDLYAACHTVGHKAGQAAFAASNDIAALIVENRTSTCQYAIGHGVLDGFALASPSDAEFRAAAEACVTLRDGEEEAQKAFKLCSDGLGHAAWTSTKDPVQAVLRCRMIADETGQELCGEGVIMQIYEPAGTAPSADLSRAAQDLPALCSNWPDTGPTRKGCYAGAGYIYTREAWTLHYARNTDGAAELNTEQRQRMQESMLDAAANCRNHPEPEGVSHCLFSMSQQIPPSIFVDDALADTICSALGEWRQRCLDFRFVIS